MSALSKQAEPGTGAFIVVSTQPYYPFCEEYATEEDALARYEELVQEAKEASPGGRDIMFVYVSPVYKRSEPLRVWS